MPEHMIQHFVTFYSPGTFFAEQSTEPIDSWDVDKAIEMARGIKERYDATPYGFRFTTRERGPDDFDSKETAKSGIYYLGGRTETREEIEARNAPGEEILRSNLRNNGVDRVLVNDNSWKATLPLYPDDVVLDVKIGRHANT